MPPNDDAVDPTVSTVSETVKRGGRGRFAAGTRPGPGRPKGERARLAAALDTLAAADAEAVLAAVLTAAKGGDMAAARAHSGPPVAAAEGAAPLELASAARRGRDGPGGRDGAGGGGDG